MDISIYFEPIELPDYKFGEDSSGFRMGDLLRSYVDKKHFPKLDDADLAIIGVNEDRNAVNNKGRILSKFIIW